MQSTTIFLLLVAITVAAYFVGRDRSLLVTGGPRGADRLHSLPVYHGYFLALCVALPMLLLLLFWLALEGRVLAALVMRDLPGLDPEANAGEISLLINNIRNLAAGSVAASGMDAALQGAADQYSRFFEYSRMLLAASVFAVGVVSGLVSWRRIAPEFRARNSVERVANGILLVASSIAILTTIGIIFSVLFEAMQFFRQVSVAEFLFGLNWSPQTAIRTDQFGSSGSFGAVPLLVGTLLITTIAMLVSVPVGLMTAIYLAEYSSSRVRAVTKPVLEILAGIPTVVYGFFAALTVAPVIRNLGESLGLNVASESALAAGLVMGIMIIPLVSSLSDDAINAVPAEIRDGAIGLGSTRSEAMLNVMIPAALPGIVGGVLLAVSRAIGETMIVVMAAGLAANLTFNPLEAVTTVTVQVVTLLVGDQEFDSAKTLAAFALGLVLFVITLCLNILALYVVRKYREEYS